MRENTAHPITAGEARARARRGTHAMDKARPDWWKRIDLYRLNISWMHGCVIGQEEDGYDSDKAIRIIAEYDPSLLDAVETDEQRFDLIVSHGFAIGAERKVGWPEWNRECDLLNSAWKEIIEERRERDDR